MLPYHSIAKSDRIHAFGSKLSPNTFSAHRALPPKGNRVVSCYALFKGWLLLSQPPTCLRRNTSLSLSLHLGTLSGDLGSFPRVHEALPSRTHWYKLGDLIHNNRLAAIFIFRLRLLEISLT